MVTDNILAEVNKTGDRFLGLSTRGLIGIVCAAAFIAYGNTLFNGFVYDDLDQILGNPWIRDLKNIPLILSKDVAGYLGGYSTSYYRPLMHIIYMITYHIFGTNSLGFHFINIVFHCGVTVLVLLVTVEIFRTASAKISHDALMAGCIASLFFAFHPIHTEVVAWAGAIPDLAFSFFFLLSLLLYIRSSQGKQFRIKLYCLSLLSFFLATLSKEPALSLPVLLFAYDILFRRYHFGLSNLIKRYVPFVLVAGIYMLMRYNALGGIAPVSRSIELQGTLYLNIFPLFIQYLQKLIFPVHLCFFYPPLQSLGFSDSRFLIPFLLTCILLICFFIAMRKSRIITFCMLLFIFPLLPAFYIPAVMEGGFGERYLYLPSAGFVMFLAWFFAKLQYKLPGNRSILIIAVLMILLLYFSGTWTRNYVWKDEYTLWSDTVKKSPQSPLPHGALGKVLLNRGQIDEAISEFQISLSLNDKSVESHLNLGVAFLAKGEIDMAIREFKATIQIAPDFAPAYYNLGISYYRMGFMKKSIYYMEKAVERDPGNKVFKDGLRMVHQAVKN